MADSIISKRIFTGEHFFVYRHTHKHTQTDTHLLTNFFNVLWSPFSLRGENHASQFQQLGVKVYEPRDPEAVCPLDPQRRQFSRWGICVSAVIINLGERFREVGEENERFAAEPYVLDVPSMHKTIGWMDKTSDKLNSFGSYMVQTSGLNITNSLLIYSESRAVLTCHSLSREEFVKKALMKPFFMISILDWGTLRSIRSSCSWSLKKHLKTKIWRSFLDERQKIFKKLKEV